MKLVLNGKKFTYFHSEETLNKLMKQWVLSVVDINPSFVHLGPVPMKLQTSGEFLFSSFLQPSQSFHLSMWPYICSFAAPLLWPKCPWGSWLPWSSLSLSWHCTCTPSRSNLPHALTSCGNYRYEKSPQEGAIPPVKLQTKSPHTTLSCYQYRRCMFEWNGSRSSHP